MLADGPKPKKKVKVKAPAKGEPTAAENRAAFEVIKKNVKNRPPEIRAGDSPSTRKADSKRAYDYKQTKQYRDQMQDARAAGVTRRRNGLLKGFSKESPREALERDDRNKGALGSDGTPRTDKQLVKFLKNGERPVKPKDENGDGRLTVGEVKTAIRKNDGEKTGMVVVKKVTSPAVKILDQTTRPVNAIAGATDAALHGENVPKAALRGIQHKDRKFFGDVLRRADVPNAIAAPVGFVADVLADPLTHGRGSIGSVADKAAAKEAKRVGEKATKAGYSKERAASMADKAGKRAASKVKADKGLRVEFFKKEVPGVTKATAHVARAASKATPRPVKKAGGAVKDIARDFNPNIAPAGTSRKAYEESRAAAREGRATQQAKSTQADRHAEGAARRIGELKKKFGPDAEPAIIDAIERGVGKAGPKRPKTQKPKESPKAAKERAYREREDARVAHEEAVKRVKELEGKRPKPEESGEDFLLSLLEGRAPKAAKKDDALEAQIAEAKARRDLAHEVKLHKHEQYETAAHHHAMASKPEPKNYPAETEMVKVDDLKGLEEWDRRPGKGQEGRRGKDYDRLREDVARNGIKDPIRVSFDPETGHAFIHEGNHRLAVAREAGLEEVPVLVHRRPGATSQNGGKTLEAVEDSGDEILRPSQVGLKGRTVEEAKKPKADPKAPRTRLTPEMLKEAREIRDMLRHEERIRRQAGVSQGKIKDYYPHALSGPLAKRLGIIENDADVPTKKGRPGPAVGSTKKRTDRRPISEVNPERIAGEKDTFSTDIPLTINNYEKETAKLLGHRKALQGLANTGRTYKKGSTLGEGEAVYHLGYNNGKYDLRKIKGSDRAKGGRYVVLDEKATDTALRRLAPPTAKSPTGRAIDTATGGFKKVAVATPGFHVRNAIGDTQMAYLVQPGQKLPGNLKAAMKVNKARVALQKRDRKTLLDLAPDSNGTIKIGGKNVAVEDILARAERHGVTQSGAVGRELTDLLHSRPRKKIQPKTRLRQAVSQKIDGRENVIRLSTFIHGLKEGLTDAEAASLSLNTHIDYGDLTPVEATVMRRIAPFYTFNARALPLHARKLVTNPGKFANYEKLRQEVARAFGQEDANDPNETEFQSRYAGIRFANDKMASFGLPITMLNELPADTDPKKYGSELIGWAQGLANPVLKDPIELRNNYSFFFRDEIRRPTGPLVAAPEWAKLLPEKVKKEIGFTENYVDKKTGKKVPGWDAYANYVIKAVPGPVNVFNQLTSQGSNQAGRGTAEKVAGALFGIKIDKIDPESAAIIRLYDAQGKALQERSALSQQGIGPADKRFRALSLQLKQIENQITEMSIKRGDKIPAGTSRAKAVAKNARTPQPTGIDAVLSRLERNSAGGSQKRIDDTIKRLEERLSK